MLDSEPPPPKEMSGRRWFRVAAAARLLEVSPQTVRRLIAAGELRAYRPAERIIRIRGEDLADFAAARGLSSRAGAARS